MTKRIYIWLIIGINLFVLTSQAVAQQEQWLRYHSSREARLIVGDMGASTPKVAIEKPQGVELPQFNADLQFFAQWPTPMVKGGRLWIALDRTDKQGRWDRLFIDSNGDGHLNDEDAITAYRTEQYYTYFGPVKVVFEVEDGPVTYHLNFLFRNRSEKDRELYVYSGGWYEGSITVGGAKKHCVLIDQNANGAFDDKSLNASESDRIRIGKKGDQDARFVGNFIEVDGELYRPEIARDGAYIKLTKAKDVKFGNIRLPETVTELTAVGENGLFTLKPEKGSCSLPVGEYRINYWIIERKDEQGNRWKLQGSAFHKNGLFEVDDGSQTELDIGEPLICTLETRTSGSSYSFNRILKGRLDERIKLTRNGSQPRAPKLHIKNKDGTYDRTFSFEYG